ncbi:uncharacterized protein LOC113443290 [Pseudonaja textilis]|uniref:uncharacterized protein LOC113443290 n=1 Tax=Pseudonaja textilis TaxID=8673 RepID=UPI000EAA109E|nr:uncharacterized protein LOC113443290 [Pseudonaja textilis]
MALADFHYTTGISSGFKVYILEGHSSFENEQRFHRLPAYRLPTCPNKRKASLDVRRIPEGQKGSKVRRLSSRPIAASQDRVATSASVPIAPIAVSCVSTSSAAVCKDSRGLPAPCTQKRPPKEPLVEPALTVTQLQQMRPSVITCAPRRSCPEAPPSPSSPLSPAKRTNGTSNFPHSQRLCPWTTNISASFSKAASPRQTIKEADGNL